VPPYSGGGGGDMEARVAKLEAHVEHIKSDISDIKTDVREVRKTTQDIKDSISSAKVWALLLYIGLGGSLLFVMAKGFKWF
jgi:prefoldin subunit 5